MSTIVLKTGKFIAIALAIVMLLLALLLYVGNSGIPFVEGTWKTERGSAYGFEIGMSKSDAFATLRSDYSLADHYIEIIWPKGSETDPLLGDFENTSDANRTDRRYGRYRQPVAELHDATLPLQMSEKWELQLPASWVNNIYLEFRDDSLIRITRDRWIFERP